MFKTPIMFDSLLKYAIICVVMGYATTINPYTDNGRETKLSKIFEAGLRKSGEIDYRNRNEVVKTLQTGIRELYGPNRNGRTLTNHKLTKNPIPIENDVIGNAICERCNVSVLLSTVRCYCARNQFDVLEQFTDISQQLDLNNQTKIFQILNLWNGVITEFPENSFVDLGFREIIIEDAINLERIHTNAFNSTAFTAENDFFLRSAPSANFSLVNQPPDYDFYAAISALVNIQYLFISLGRNMAHEIPNNAFRPINGLQSRLLAIIFELGFNISRIGEYAFSQIPNLNDGIIDFSEIPIGYISPHAFDFSYQSDRFVDIDLRLCGLNEDSFAAGSFIGRNRPIRLYLSHNNIKYIRREVFYDFFDGDHRSKVYFDDNPLNCSDTEPFKWLLLSPIRNEYMARIIYPYCSNGTELWHIDVGDGSAAHKLFYTKLILLTNIVCFLLYLISVENFV